MANFVLMPQMGISEESAILQVWKVKKGDNVNVGDVIFSIETGKAAFDIESEYAGEVLALLAEEGDEVLIKVPVCVIGEKGEKFDMPESGEKASEPQPEAKIEEIKEEIKVEEKTPVSAEAKHDGELRISPRAKNLAEKSGVNINQANPTGAEGRIIERDIRQLIENPPVKSNENLVANQSKPVQEEIKVPTAAFEDKALPYMRKLIAKNMMNSLATTAQLTHTSSFDASKIKKYRELLKSDPELCGINLTDMILFAVTRTLKEFPELNAWMMEDKMRCFSEVNLACAVDTERGLMVPVIFDASKKSLLQISNELKKLAEACRNGSISPDLLSGGSFTVSNLGVYGIEHFTPIINAPQTGILGVNTITTRIKEENGAIVPYPCMSLSLTYDHCAIDGAPASRFLQKLCKNLENFPKLLAL